ncbi:GPP34 family phosphoprotein [Amycolatopsis sp. NPDC059021]|uniref:GOLPH3/VPS74 family protein n=1 Tax=Amycolatopsis sp. NPDC059021 TaxID=3346704 RepID=UPI00366ACBD3
MSELSLPAKAYLLACDPGGGRLRDRQRVSLLVRAAALTDLVRRGRIADEDGKAVIVDERGTGDLVLDDVLAEVAGDRRSWRSWVRRGARDTLQSLETQLDAAGTIELKVSRALGLFTVRRPVVLDGGAVARLRGAVDYAVRGTTEVSEVDAADAALAALVAAVELRTVVSRRDRRRHRARVAELEERAGAAVPALRKVFRELRAARAAAVSNASNHGGG